MKAAASQAAPIGWDEDDLGRSLVQPGLPVGPSKEATYRRGQARVGEVLPSSYGVSQGASVGVGSAGSPKGRWSADAGAAGSVRDPRLTLDVLGSAVGTSALVPGDQ